MINILIIMIMIIIIMMIKRMNLAVAVLCGHAFTLIGELISVQVAIISFQHHHHHMDDIWW